MRRILRTMRREEGFALAIVVLLTTVLAVLSVTLMALAANEQTRSGQNTRREAAYQAAEAGVEDYIAKMVDDRLYYLHEVHDGESTRQEPGGTTVAGGNAWGYGLSWTYPNGADTWRTLPNGYEYNLQITPPGATDSTLRILSTGRRTGSTNEYKVIETRVRPSSLADFYRVVDGPVSWGAGAITNGKIYANGNIDHDGIATGNIYSEGSITGSYTLQNGAQTYNSSTIRSVIKNPIVFANFVTAFVDVQRAAQSGGIYLNVSGVAAWQLTFHADGTVTYVGCTKKFGRDVADTAPVCTATAANTVPVPANGAIYTAQTALVLGEGATGATVNGRVTVASATDIVVGGNIGPVSPSDDVLGLAATTNVTIAKWVPNDMTWTCSVLAQNGTWQTYVQDGSHNTMTFRGSSATKNGGGLQMFDTRDYGYLPDLQYLPPPWFPTVEDAYTIVLFRELPGT